MRARILMIAFVMMGFIANAQENNETEIDIRDILESVTESLPDDYDMTELVDVLMRYRKHPIDLNHTSPEELKSMVFLSPLQISNFFAYVKENGQFVDPLELQGIDGFDVKTVQNLLPFVAVNVQPEYQQLSFKTLLSLEKMT
ncbi:helix-hairpin-helix domain-containing protein [Pedobacter miscanthi]|jgi:hypothetical protein|uniref:helix-hairpin-helix domain-containing protein n=1 Tax=Pedobacter miscanthi TaxID=2259170 RepID=UPI002930DC67|nr:helix-hairpin-helix domain-containing protein [Pedobacter miscanthi]